MDARLLTMAVDMDECLCIIYLYIEQTGKLSRSSILKKLFRSMGNVCKQSSQQESIHEVNGFMEERMVVVVNDVHLNLVHLLLDHSRMQ